MARESANTIGFEEVSALVLELPGLDDLEIRNRRAGDVYIRQERTLSANLVLRAMHHARNPAGGGARMIAIVVFVGFFGRTQAKGLQLMAP